MSFIPDGLVLHHVYGDGTGYPRRGTIIDRSGNGNAGTVYGAPALDFDGVNDKAAVATPWDALVGHRYAVLAMRVYITAAATDRCLFTSRHANNTNVKFLCYIKQTTDILEVVARAGGSGDTATTFVSDTAPTENAWHSLMVLVDAESDTMTFWDNGALLASTGNAQAFSQDTFAADVPVGQSFGELTGGAWDFTGKMKWMGYGGMDTPVTLEDAQKYYDNPQAWLEQAGLDAWWPCTEGAGDPYDLSGNGHNLTLTGTTWDVTTNGGNAGGTPALDFNGVNEKADVSTPFDDLAGSQCAWLACRVYLESQGALRYIYVTNFAGSPAGRFAVLVNGDEKLDIGGRSLVGDSFQRALSSATISANTWHSLLVCMDLGSDGTVANGLTAHAWLDGAVLTMGAFDGDLGQGTFGAASPPDHQAFGLDSSNNNDFAGKMKWMGIKGDSAPPTLTDAQDYHNDPQAWLEQAGLDAWWPCNEGTGTNVDNAEGTAGRDLTLSNAGWVVSGNEDSFTAGKRWFDGVDDYVSVADTAELRFGTADFQIHIWMALPAGAGDGRIAAKESGLGSFWQIRVVGGKPDFRGGGGVIAVANSGSDLRNTGPHLVTVLRDGNDVSLLIDGVSVGTDATGGENLNGAVALTIGSNVNGNYQVMDMYEVMIGKTPKTIAKGTADAKAILETSNYR